MLPLCWDHTRIKGGDALGRFGPGGIKFDETADWRSNRVSVSPVLVKWLCEMVIPNDPKETEYFNKKLKTQCFLFDGAQTCPSSRPRLWWSNTNTWNLAPSDSRFRCSTQKDGLRVLNMCVPQLILPEEVWVPPGWALHPSVLSGQTKIPFYTSPAPTDSWTPSSS